MSLVTEYSWGEAREEIGQVSRDEFIRCDEEFRIRSVGDFKSLIDSDCVRHDAMLRSITRANCFIIHCNPVIHPHPWARQLWLNPRVTGG